MTDRTPLQTFCDELISSHEALPWVRGASRQRVDVELGLRGYRLVEDGDDWDPRLKRFTALPLAPGVRRMKALTVRAPWAGLLASGRKRIELRKQSCSYRGPLLIVAGLKESTAPALVTDDERAAALAAPRGVTLCLVDVIDCRRATPDDAHDACTDVTPGEWAWVIANPRPVPQQAVSGKLGLFWVELRG